MKNKEINIGHTDERVEIVFTISLNDFFFFLRADPLILPDIQAILERKFSDGSTGIRFIFVVRISLKCIPSF
jgi:hypothetical protein